MTGPMAESDPIRRTHLHGEVLRILSQMIMRGEMAPGSRVQERVICEQLGISRTPLREALKVLASRGLVELQPSRGARIAPLSAAEVAESFDVLAVLERHAGAIAAERLDDAALHTLSRMHDEMIELSRRQAFEPMLAIDLDIHRRIVAATGNRTLVGVHEGLALKVERARWLATDGGDRVRRSMEEHAAIIAALLAHDAAAAADALYTHCLRTRDAVVASVVARFGPADRSEAA